MVVSCCVVGCTNRWRKGTELRFFRFPTSKKQLKAWKRAVDRRDWEPNAYTRICSDHFVSGWPDYLDSHDPDYAPSLFPCRQKLTAREQRNKREGSVRRYIVETFEEAEIMQRKFTEDQLKASLSFHDYPMLKEAASDTRHVCTEQQDGGS